ncbi:lipocalin-like domain-containing protein [Sphingomonas sp. BK235]|uniref:lipocalin-like domain-containing protein n=1 Tax=Sphingomonas sp. BK235 TaxID=2512131 RepID=UPI001044188A|nr:lipocalin-like domain-containing protein [Sphingomonas sp. BK235]TCP31019.1 lipocalin-like protein [Sphingomonas sp. BK235]
MPGQVLRWGAALLAALGAGAAAPEASAPNPLVGTWILDRLTDTPDGGPVLMPFGSRPVGQFVFTANGHFAFGMMRRPAVDDVATAGPYRDIVPNWYLSYFGRYRYDPGGPRWIAEVQGGNVPAYVGTVQRRDFAIRGSTLRVWARYTVAGRTFTAVRTLHRAQ